MLVSGNTQAPRDCAAQKRRADIGLAELPFPALAAPEPELRFLARLIDPQCAPTLPVRGKPDAAALGADRGEDDVHSAEG